MYTAASRFSLLPIGMQTPVASTDAKVHMVVWYAFFDRNGSSAFYSRVAIDLIKVVIWNTEPLVRFEMCL
jgi:hypothetical protein